MRRAAISSQGDRDRFRHARSYGSLAVTRMSVGLITVRFALPLMFWPSDSASS